MSNILLEKLDHRINDETLTPAQRESARALRDKILRVCLHWCIPSPIAPIFYA
jgi:hypothetical protein